MIEGIDHVRAVVWSFDGVLNRLARPDASGLLPWQRALADEGAVDVRALGRAIEARRAALSLIVVVLSAPSRVKVMTTSSPGR